MQTINVLLLLVLGLLLLLGGYFLLKPKNELSGNKITLQTPSAVTQYYFNDLLLQQGNYQNFMVSFMAQYDLKAVCSQGIFSWDQTDVNEVAENILNYGTDISLYSPYKNTNVSQLINLTQLQLEQLCQILVNFIITLFSLDINQVQSLVQKKLASIAQIPTNQKYIYILAALKTYDSNGQQNFVSLIQTSTLQSLDQYLPSTFPVQQAALLQFWRIISTSFYYVTGTPPQLYTYTFGTNTFLHPQLQLLLALSGSTVPNWALQNVSNLQFVQPIDCSASQSYWQQWFQQTAIFSQQYTETGFMNSSASAFIQIFYQGLQSYGNYLSAINTTTFAANFKVLISQSTQTSQTTYFTTAPSLSVYELAQSINTFFSDSAFQFFNSTLPLFNIQIPNIDYTSLTDIVSFFSFGVLSLTTIPADVQTFLNLPAGSTIVDFKTQINAFYKLVLQYYIQLFSINVENFNTQINQYLQANQLLLEFDVQYVYIYAILKQLNQQGQLNLVTLGLVNSQNIADPFVSITGLNLQNKILLQEALSFFLVNTFGNGTPYTDIYQQSNQFILSPAAVALTCALFATSFQTLQSGAFLSLWSSSLSASTLDNFYGNGAFDGGYAFNVSQNTTIQSLVPQTNAIGNYLNNIFDYLGITLSDYTSAYTDASLVISSNKCLNFLTISQTIVATNGFYGIQNVINSYLDFWNNSSSYNYAQYMINDTNCVGSSNPLASLTALPDIVLDLEPSDYYLQKIIAAKSMYQFFTLFLPMYDMFTIDSSGAYVPENNYAELPNVISDFINFGTNQQDQGQYNYAQMCSWDTLPNTSVAVLNEFCMNIFLYMAAFFKMNVLTLYQTVQQNLTSNDITINSTQNYIQFLAAIKCYSTSGQQAWIALASNYTIPQTTTNTISGQTNQLFWELWMPFWQNGFFPLNDQLPQLNFARQFYLTPEQTTIDQVIQQKLYTIQNDQLSTTPYTVPTSLPDNLIQSNQNFVPDMSKFGWSFPPGTPISSDISNYKLSFDNFEQTFLLPQLKVANEQPKAQSNQCILSFLDQLQKLQNATSLNSDVFTYYNMPALVQLDDFRLCGGVSGTTTQCSTFTQKLYQYEYTPNYFPTFLNQVFDIQPECTNYSNYMNNFYQAFPYTDKYLQINSICYFSQNTINTAFSAYKKFLSDLDDYFGSYQQQECTYKTAFPQSFQFKLNLYLHPTLQLFFWLQWPSPAKQDWTITLSCRFSSIQNPILSESQYYNQGNFINVCTNTSVETDASTDYIFQPSSIYQIVPYIFLPPDKNADIFKTMYIQFEAIDFSFINSGKLASVVQNIQPANYQPLVPLPTSSTNFAYKHIYEIQNVFAALLYQSPNYNINPISNLPAGLNPPTTVSLINPLSKKVNVFFTENSSYNWANDQQYNPLPSTFSDLYNILNLPTTSFPNPPQGPEPAVQLSPYSSPTISAAKTSYNDFLSETFSLHPPQKSTTVKQILSMRKHFSRAINHSLLTTNTHNKNKTK